MDLVVCGVWVLSLVLIVWVFFSLGGFGRLGWFGRSAGFDHLGGFFSFGGLVVCVVLLFGWF